MDIYRLYLDFINEKAVYCSDATVAYYKLNVGRFVDYIGSDTDVMQIQQTDIYQYLTHLRSSSLKNSSINTYIRALKVFWHWLLAEEFISEDLFRKVKYLRDDSENVIPLYATEVDQIDSCYNAKCETGLRNICIIHCMLDAGLRMNEVCILKMSDLHFDKNLIYVLGKGSKYRVVPMCPTLKRLLYRYCIFYRSYLPDAVSNEYVFVCPGTMKPISKTVVEQLFRRLKRRAGIDRLHPHLLRHTFATSYIMGGGNLEFLRIMLGHSDYVVTRRYLHLASQYSIMRSDIYQLDRVFFETAY